MLATQQTGQLKHDYESSGTGGNRFATILLYMSDLGETDGGETVFPYGIPSNIPEEKRITKDEVRRKIGQQICLYLLENANLFRTRNKLDSLIILYTFASYNVIQQAREQLRNSEEARVLRTGSWEEELVRRDAQLYYFVGKNQLVPILDDDYYT